MQSTSSGPGSNCCCTLRSHLCCRSRCSQSSAQAGRNSCHRGSRRTCKYRQCCSSHHSIPSSCTCKRLGRTRFHIQCNRRLCRNLCSLPHFLCCCSNCYRGRCQMNMLHCAMNLACSSNPILSHHYSGCLRNPAGQGFLHHAENILIRRHNRCLYRNPPGTLIGRLHRCHSC